MTNPRCEWCGEVGNEEQGPVTGLGGMYHQGCRATAAERNAMPYPISNLLLAEFGSKLGERDAWVKFGKRDDALSLRDMAAEYLGEYEHGSVDLEDVAPLSLPELAQVLIDFVSYCTVVAETKEDVVPK